MEKNAKTRMRFLEDQVVRVEEEARRAREEDFGGAYLSIGAIADNHPVEVLIPTAAMGAAGSTVNWAVGTQNDLTPGGVNWIGEMSKRTRANSINSVSAQASNGVKHQKRPDGSAEKSNHFIKKEK